MVTLREIAELAGVSITTVSNVLHGNTSRVSPATIERVQSLLRERGYISRMGLRVLQGASSQIIGVVITVDKYFESSVIADYFYGSILGALEPAIRAAGYYMMLYASENVEDVYRMAATWNVDGLIAVSFSGSAYQKLRTLTGRPVVGIDLYNLVGEIYNCGLEDEEGAFQMTRFLIENGYHDVLIMANSDMGVDHQRWLGYRRAHAGAGMTCRRQNFVILDVQREGRLRAYEELAARITPDTAWFFLNDYYAIEAMSFLQERHYRTPDDIGIAGFDGAPVGEMVYPALTTVYQNLTLKATIAFDLLMRLVRGEEIEQRDVRLATTLMVRGSVRLQSAREDELTEPV